MNDYADKKCQGCRHWHRKQTKEHVGNRVAIVVNPDEQLGYCRESIHAQLIDLEQDIRVGFYPLLIASTLACSHFEPQPGVNGDAQGHDVPPLSEPLPPGSVLVGKRARA